jgi:sugar lactone lactonase YvrE
MSPNVSAAAGALRCVLDVRASLGECPVWSTAEQVLYWVDINAPSLNRFDPSTGGNRAMAMPSSIGCFALRRRGGFVVALRDGVWLADTDGTLERKVAAAPFEPAHHRFNDGRCDPQGRFFAGTMNEQRDAPSGALYRIDSDFRVTEVLGNLTISNGLGWSPDGRTMYHADTPTLTINAFAFDAKRHTAEWAYGALRRANQPAGRRCGRQRRPPLTAFYRGRVVRLRCRRHARVASGPRNAPTMCLGIQPADAYVTSARQQRDDAESRAAAAVGGIFARRWTSRIAEPMFSG